MRLWVLILVLCASPAWADVALQPSPTTALGQAWGEWKAKIPSWTEYMPGMVVFRNLGRAEDNASILWQKAKNLRAFDRYCGRGAPFTQQPFCMAVTPSLRRKPSDWFAQSPLRILFDDLIARAGPATEAGRDAATLLYSMRVLMEYPEGEPSHPDRMLGLLYGQFANCVPTACQVAVTRPSGFQEAMRGLVAYLSTYGGEVDLQAVSLLRRAGF